MMLGMRKRVSSNTIRLMVMLISIISIAAILKPEGFIHLNNLQSMLKQLPEYGVLSIAMTLAMIMGGIDLSLVANANLTAILAAKILKLQYFSNDSLDILAACSVALLTGLIIGAINGFFISQLNIPPMLATLGMQQLLRGIGIVITQGRAVSSLPYAFSKFGNRNLFGIIPYVFILYIAMIIIVGFMLSKTKFGMRLYMMGTNPSAAKFSGIRIKRITISTFAICGMLAAVAGLIFTVRFNSAKPDNGVSYTMLCILVAVLGGVNPKGGSGTLTGVVIAVFILQALSSGLNMFENLSSFYRDLLWGSALILLMIANHIIDERNVKRLMIISK